MTQKLKVNRSFKTVFSDYEIHVFDIGKMKESDISKFTSDFRNIVEYLVKSKRSESERIANIDELDNLKNLKHVDAALKSLRVFTGDEFFNELNSKIGGSKVRSILDIYVEQKTEDISKQKSEVETQKAEIEIQKAEIETKAVLKLTALDIL